MTQQTKMPEPVAYAIFAENGNIRLWSTEPCDLPDLDSLGPMHHLITTDQAEAYAAAKAREALEEAASIAGEKSAALPHYSGLTRGYAEGRAAAAAAIRALIPK